MRVDILPIGLMNELHLKWRRFKILVCEALNLTEPFWFSWPTLIAFQQGKGAGASSLMVIRVLGSMSPPRIPQGRVSSWPFTRPPLTPSLGGEGRTCVALVGVGADVWSPHRIPTDNRGRGSCYCPSGMKVLAPYLAFPNTTLFGGGGVVPMTSWQGWGSPFPTQSLLLGWEWDLVAQMVKNPPANARDIRDTVWSLGWEDPLEKRMATHSSILAWRIPMDRGAWWATVHGIAESRTWQKRLSGRAHMGVRPQCAWAKKSYQPEVSVLQDCPFPGPLSRESRAGFGLSLTASTWHFPDCRLLQL